jgi:hypothetical protein
MPLALASAVRFAAVATSHAEMPCDSNTVISGSEPRPGTWLAKISANSSTLSRFSRALANEGFWHSGGFTHDGFGRESQCMSGNIWPLRVWRIGDTQYSSEDPKGCQSP